MATVLFAKVKIIKSKEYNRYMWMRPNHFNAKGFAKCFY